MRNWSHRKKMMKAVICRSTGLMWINYFKDSEETSVQWHMQDFVNGEAFRSFSEEPTGSEIGGYHPGKFCKLPTSQSPSKICRAAAVGKKCDASTSQSNIGVSRKRLKLSIPGSTVYVMYGLFYLKPNKNCRLTLSKAAIIWTFVQWLVYLVPSWHA